MGKYSIICNEDRSTEELMFQTPFLLFFQYINNEFFLYNRILLVNKLFLLIGYLVT